MSKLKRKVTVDADERRKPSVFERLGPGAVRRSYENYDDSDSDRDSSPKKCVHWMREGTCSYGNACKFQHGPFTGSKGKGRHEADSSEDLRLRVKRKDKLSDKPGSDSDASEAARLKELDYKKELELEQQRQMIQRQLKELDSQEAVHVRGHGHENFVIQKKIMSRASSSDSDSDRSRTRGHAKKAKKKKKKKISPNKRSPSPDSDDHHKKHKKKAKNSGKKKRRESLEEIPLKLHIPEPDVKGSRKLLSPLKFKKSHKPVMSQKISAFHSDEEEEPAQPPPKRQLQRSFSSSSDDIPRSQLSQKTKEKRSLTPVKKKKAERKASPEFVKEKRKHSKGRERSLSKSRDRSRSSSYEDKKVKKVEKVEKKKIKKEEYYERRKDVDFTQRPEIMERPDKARDHTPMSDFQDFSPEPEAVVKKKKDKKKEKKKKDRSLSIELDRKHKKDKNKDRDRSVSPSSSRYSQKLDKRGLERSLERGSRREMDPRVSSPRGKGYGERRGKSPELSYRGGERSPATRYKDEGRKERDLREIRDPREMRDPRDISREGREPREGRELREGRDPRDREREREPRDPREGRDPRDMSRGRDGERGEYERDRDRDRERERDYEFERRGREGREPPPDSRGRPPGAPGSYRDQPPGREYDRVPPEGPPREPGQERFPPEFRDERRGERYGDQRDPHFQRPPPGYEDRPGYGRDRPPPGERGPYGRPDRPDREPIERRDPGDRYDRERFHGDPRGRGDPRFEGPGLGPRPPYRDPGWDRGRGRPPRPWGRGGPDRRYDDRSRRGEFEGRRDEFYVPERRDWPNRREEERRPEDKDKDRPDERKEERVEGQEDREKDKVPEGSDKDGKKEKPEEDRVKKEQVEDIAERDRSRKRRVSGEEPSQSPKRTKEGSPALSTHSKKSVKSVRNIEREDTDKMSDRGSDRSRHTARSRGREDKARSVDGEDRRDGERKRSRSRDRKRSRSRSRAGSTSGESKRRRTEDREENKEKISGKPDEMSEKPVQEKKDEPSTVLDNIEQNFSDWSDNDSDDDILNQPELTPPPVPFERVASPSRRSEGSQQSKPSKDRLEDSGHSRKELVPGVPEQDVDDFESISSEESSTMGVVKTAAVNALEIDWASLNRDSRPKPTTGSALQRFKPGNLFAKIGLSRQYAGEELYKEVVSVCQRQEETEAGEEEKSKDEGGEKEKEASLETDKDRDKQHEETTSEKTDKEKFEFKHDIAMFHSSAVQKLRERRNLLSDIGPYRRALCARRDLEIRRQLCKVDKVLDHTQVYPSQDADNELCKLSIQLFRQAKSCTDTQTSNNETTLVTKEVTCA